jgi:hypothetical protein
LSQETTPKPRKFFKSRNSAPPAEIQQQIAMQQQLAQQQYQSSHNNHIHHQSSSDEHHSPHKSTKKKQASPKKEKVAKVKVEKPKKPPKVKKEKVVKVREVQEVPEDLDSETEVTPTRRGRSIAEATRTSGRVRGRMVNYNEDEGDEEFMMRTERRINPRLLLQAQELAAAQQNITSSQESIVDVPAAPEINNTALNHPPIVLRISKVRNFVLFF